MYSTQERVDLYGMVGPCLIAQVAKSWLLALLGAEFSLTSGTEGTFSANDWLHAEFLSQSINLFNGWNTDSYEALVTDSGHHIACRLSWFWAPAQLFDVAGETEPCGMKKAGEWAQVPTISCITADTGEGAEGKQ